MTSLFGCTDTRNSGQTGQVFVIATLITVASMLIAFLVRRVLAWSLLITVMILAIGLILNALVINNIARRGRPLIISALILSLAIFVPALISEVFARNIFLSGGLAGSYISYLGTWGTAQSSRQIIIAAIFFAGCILAITRLSM